jgi:hypothetical protein
VWTERILGYFDALLRASFVKSRESDIWILPHGSFERLLKRKRVNFGAGEVKRNEPESRNFQLEHKSMLACKT